MHPAERQAMESGSKLGSLMVRLSAYDAEPVEFEGTLMVALRGGVFPQEGFSYTGKMNIYRGAPKNRTSAYSVVSVGEGSRFRASFLTTDSRNWEMKEVAVDSGARKMAVIAPLAEAGSGEARFYAD